MDGLFGLLFTKLKLPPASAIAGKTILITGANTGLGKEAARHAVSLGAGVVILGSRDISKGEQARKELELTPGRSPDSQILVWQIDLDSFASVKAFATRARQYVRDKGGRLDMAIMNAGIASMNYATSPEGWEKSLQVNVLSTALLCFHLLPLLRLTHERVPSAPPHLTILSSDAHKNVKFSEKTNDEILVSLNGREQWQKSQDAGGPIERYGVSKLMDIFLAAELAERVPRDQHNRPIVVVNTVTPGFCKSDLMTREPAPLILKVVQALLARPVQEGSKTLLAAATAGSETHGQWLENQKVADPGRQVTTSVAVAVRKRVWKEVVDILSQVDPEIQQLGIELV